MNPLLVPLNVAGAALPATPSEKRKSGGTDPHRIAAVGKRLRHCRGRYEPSMPTVLNDPAADGYGLNLLYQTQYTDRYVY